MADTTTRIELSDECTKAERWRSEALAAAVVLLADYDPPPGKTRADAAISVARNLEKFLGGTT